MAGAVSARKRIATAAAPETVAPRPDAPAPAEPADFAAPDGHEARLARAGAMLQVAAALCWIPQAACLARAVDGLSAGEGLSDVLPLAAGIVLSGVLRAGLDAGGGRLAFRAARRRLTRLRETAVAAVARRSPLDPGRSASGLAASVVAEQAEAVLPYFARYLPARGKATVVPLAILAAVMPFSWVAALVLLMAAPLIPLFMALIGLKAREASESQMLELGGMNAFLLDRLRGLATIRAMDGVEATALRLRDAAERLRRRTMAVLRIAFLSSAVLELFSALGVALVAVYVGFHFLGQLPFGAWGGKLSLGDGLFILLLAPAFFEPLRELAAVWHDRAAGEAAIAALGRLSQAGEPMPGADGPDPAPTPVAAACGVTVTGLSVRYGGGEAVLSGLSLCVRPGEKVALTGASGDGKSTLLAAIAGLVGAEAGRIVIDGTPLTDASAARLRARMAWLGQKPHLFSGTVLGNVALGRPDVGPREAEAAMALAAFDTVAATRPRGLAIGEGGGEGGGLSGGEALRLALARAAANRAAGLVLADEPTAHLDADTAAQVRAGLLRIAEGRTLVVATHDAVLAAAMDRVVTVERGRIVPAPAATEGRP